MADNIKRSVELVLKLTDQTSGAFKKAVSGIEEYRASLKRLEIIDAFGKLKAQIAAAQIAWDSAKASVDSFTSKVSSSRAIIESQATAIKTSQAQIKSLGTTLEKSKRDLNSLTEAYNNQKISVSQYDESLKILNQIIKAQSGSLNKLESELASLLTVQKQSVATLKQEESGFKQSQKAASSFENQITSATSAVQKMDKALVNAGIDTKDLSTTQKTLAADSAKVKAGLVAEAAALKKVEAESKALAAVEKARGVIGVQTNQSIRNEITKLISAYNVLKTSLKGKELQTAFDTTLTKVKQLKAELLTVKLDKAFAGVEKLTTDISIALTAIGGAMAAPFVLGIKNAKNFEFEMAKVGAISSATGSEFEQMTMLAENMGRTTLYTATEAAEGLRYLSMAGLAATESITALPSMLQLAAAGALDLGTAADIATNIMSGYGMQAQDLTKINDVLVQGFTNSNSTLEELGTSFAYVGPVAKATGLDFEDVVTSLGQLANAGIKGCYDDQTEVLTRKGFIKWSEATINDEYLTLNKETDKIEYQKPVQMFKYEVDEKLLRIKNKHVDLLVTDNHNMYVQKRVKEEFELIHAKDIYGKEVKYKKSGVWEGSNQESYIIPGFDRDKGFYSETVAPLSIPMNLWLEFYGYWITDGSLVRKEENGDYKVVLSQAKPFGRNRIEQLLTLLPFHFSKEKINYVISSQQLFNELIKFGKEKQERRVPDYIKELSPALLEVFYDAIVVGDGSTNGEIFGSNKLLIDDFAEIILKIGWSPTVRRKIKKGDVKFINGRKIEATKDGYVLTVNKKQLTPSFSPTAYNKNTVHGQRLTGKMNCGQEWVDYKGLVYCAEVPNNVLFVRRNGTSVFCGNSLGGTALRGMLARLLDPSKKAAGVLAELGEKIGQSTIQMRNADGSFVGMVSLLEQLKKASITAEQAITVFGVRAGPGMIALLEQGVPAFKNLRDKMLDAEGRAGEVAEAMQNTLGGAVTLLQSALDGLGKSIGDDFIPMLTEMAKIGATVANWATDFKESLWPLGSVLSVVSGLTAGLVASLGVAGLAFQHLLPGVKQVIVGLELYRISLIKTAAAAGVGAVTTNSFALAMVGLGMKIKETVFALGRFLTTNVVGVIITITGAIYGLYKAYSILSPSIEKAVEEQAKIVKSILGAVSTIERYQETISQLSKDSVEFSDENKRLKNSLDKTGREMNFLSERARIASASISAITGNLLDGGKALKDYADYAKQIDVKETSKNFQLLATQLAEATNEIQTEIFSMKNWVAGIKSIYNMIPNASPFSKWVFDKTIGAGFEYLSKKIKEFGNVTTLTWDQLKLVMQDKGPIEKTKEWEEKFKAVAQEAENTLKKMEATNKIDYSKTGKEIVKVAVEMGYLVNATDLTAQAFEDAFNRGKKASKDAANSIASDTSKMLNEEKAKKNIENLTKTHVQGIKLLEDLWGTFQDKSLKSEDEVHKKSISNFQTAFWEKEAVATTSNQKMIDEYRSAFEGMDEEQKKAFVKLILDYEAKNKALIDSDMKAAEKQKTIALLRNKFIEDADKLAQESKNQNIVDGYASELAIIKDASEAKQIEIELSAARGIVTQKEAAKQVNEIRVQELKDSLALSEKRLKAEEGLSSKASLEYVKAAKANLVIQKSLNDELVKQAKAAREAETKAVKNSVESQINIIKDRANREKSIVEESEKAIADIKLLGFEKEVELADRLLKELESKSKKDSEIYQEALKERNDAVEVYNNEFLKQAEDTFKKQSNLVQVAADSEQNVIEQMIAKRRISEENGAIAIAKIQEDAAKKFLTLEKEKLEAFIKIRGTSGADYEEAAARLAAAEIAASNATIKVIEANNQKTIKIQEAKVKKIEDLAKLELKNIEIAKSKGLMNEQEASKETLSIAEKKYEELLQIAQDYFDEVSSKQNKGTEDYKNAQQKVLDAENALIDARIAKAEEAKNRLQKLRDSENNLRKAQYDEMLRVIQEQEDEEVLSHEEAAEKKIEAELKFLEAKVLFAKQAVDQAILEFGRETSEHKNAIAERIAAEGALASAKTATTKAIKDAQKADYEAIGTTNENTEAVWGGAKAYGRIGKTRQEAAKAAKESTKATKENTLAFGESDRAAYVSSEAITGVGSALKSLTEKTKEATAGLAEISSKFKDLGKSFNKDVSNLGERFGTDFLDKFTAVKGELTDFGEAATKIYKDSVSAFSKSTEESVAEVEKAIDSFGELYDEASNYMEELISNGEELNKKIKEVAADRIELEEENVKYLSELQSEMTGKIADEIDLREKYNEQYAKGQKALLKGEFEIAKEYFLKARDLSGDLVKQIKGFSDEILNIEKTTTETIRDLQYGLMSDVEEWNARRADADKKASEARMLFSEGESKLALELFKEAQSLYKGLAEEVKDSSGEVVISLEQSTAVAIAGIQDTGDKARKVLEQQRDQTKTSTEKAISLAKNAASQAENAMSAYSDALTDQQKQNELAIAETQKQINVLIGKMDDLAASVNQDMSIDIKTIAAEKALDALTDKYGNAMASIIENLLKTQSAMKKLNFGIQGAGDIHDMYGRQVASFKKQIAEYANRTEEAQRLVYDAFGLNSSSSSAGKSLSELAQLEKYGRTRAEEGGLITGSSSAPTITIDKETSFSGQLSLQEAMKKMGYASGGQVDGTGGIKLPGYGTVDSVPALLTEGERVTRSISTRAMDNAVPGFMDAVNSVKSVSDVFRLFGDYFKNKKEKFKTGGVVGAVQKFKTGGIVQKFAAGGPVFDVGYVNSVISILTSGLANMVESIMGELDVESYYRNEEKLRSERLKNLEQMYDKEVLMIAFAVAKGEKTEEEGDKEKLESKLKFYQESLKLAKQNLNLTSRLFGYQSDEFKKAQDEMIDIQNNIDYVLIDQIKVSNAERTKIEEEAKEARIKQLKESMEAREKEIQNAYNKESLIIAFAAAKEEITESKASERNLNNKMDFYKRALNAAKENVNKIGQVYGLESEEYKDAQEEIAKIQNNINWLLVDQAKLAQKAKEDLEKGEADDPAIRKQQEEISKAYDERLKKINDFYNEQEVALELSLQKGEITEEQAMQRSLQLRINKNKEIQSAAQENANSLGKIFSQESDEYKNAQEDIVKAQLEAKWLGVDQVKLAKELELREEEEAKKKVIDAHQAKLDEINNLYNRQAQDIENALAQNEITEKEAADRLIQVQIEKNKAILASATEQVDGMGAIYDQDSEPYKAALQEKINAELSFEDAILERLKNNSKRTAEFRDAELALTKQQLDSELDLIKTKEENGVLTKEEANVAKAELEKAYIEEQDKLAQIALEEAINLYGIDSAEYKKAVADKINSAGLLYNAELALINAKEAAGIIAHAEAVSLKKAAEIKFLKSTIVDVFATNEAVAKLYGENSLAYQAFLKEKEKALLKFGKLQEEILERRDEDYLSPGESTTTSSSGGEKQTGGVLSSGGGGVEGGAVSPPYMSQTYFGPTGDEKQKIYDSQITKALADPEIKKNIDKATSGVESLLSAFGSNAWDELKDEVESLINYVSLAGTRDFDFSEASRRSDDLQSGLVDIKNQVAPGLEAPGETIVAETTAALNDVAKNLNDFMKSLGLNVNSNAFLDEIKYLKAPWQMEAERSIIDKDGAVNLANYIAALPTVSTPLPSPVAGGAATLPQPEKIVQVDLNVGGTKHSLQGPENIVSGLIKTLEAQQRLGGL